MRERKEWVRERERMSGKKLKLYHWLRLPRIVGRGRWRELFRKRERERENWRGMKMFSQKRRKGSKEWRETKMPGFWASTRSCRTRLSVHDDGKETERERERVRGWKRRREILTEMREWWREEEEARKGKEGVFLPSFPLLPSHWVLQSLFSLLFCIREGRNITWWMRYVLNGIKMDFFPRYTRLRERGREKER